MTETLSEVTDVAAERHCLAAILADPEQLGDVVTVIGPEDLTGMHALLMTVLVRMTADGIPIEPLRVVAEMRRAGHTQPEHTAMITDLLTRHDVISASAGWYAQQVARASGLRRFQQLAVRVDQIATAPDAEPETVATFLSEQLTRLDNVLDNGEQEPDAISLIARDLSVEWLVPDLLARTDRMILVGHEGHGKSMYLTQIGACLAAGLHPWTLAPIERCRVLIVDAENDPPEVTDRLDRLQAACIKRGQPLEPGWLTYCEREYGLDLADPVEATWLLRLVAKVQPQVLIIGPMYQLIDSDLAKEEASTQLKAALNRVRARARCTVLMEAHVGNEDHRGDRPVRPYGSSMWRRWAGLGHSLVPERDEVDHKRIIPGHYRLLDYRGRRSRRPGWPSRVMWNPDEDGFPWIDSDIDAFYGRVRQQHWSD